MALTGMREAGQRSCPTLGPVGAPAAVPEASDSLFTEAVVPIDQVRYELVAAFHSDSKGVAQAKIFLAVINGATSRIGSRIMAA